jgi:predicted amidohydrolase
MLPANIQRIGFYHCVHFEAPFDPVAKLREAIHERIEEEATRDQAWDISNSLIVLPEAFNLGKYDSRSLPNQSPQDFLESLRRVSEEHRIVFVAGALDGRHNAAYLVDSADVHLMCKKIGDDLTGIYDPCTENPDQWNPITLGSASVGALICMDATNGGSRAVRDRREHLLNRLTARDGHKLLCVPSRFNWDGPDSLTCLPDVDNFWYIVADGLWKRGRNDSRVIDSSLRPKIEAGERSEIAFWPLP